MRRSAGPVLLALLLALVLPVTAHAQGGIFLGGGATIPTGDYGKYAETGWMGFVGGFASVGSKGVFLGGEAFYGSNSHDDSPSEFSLSGGGGSSDKTNLYGADAIVGYRFGDPAKVGPYVSGNLGFMVHKYSPASGAGYDGDSSTGFLYGATAGVDIPAGKVNIWFEGRWMNASFGAEEGSNDGSSTGFFGLFAGITIPVGGN